MRRCFVDTGVSFGSYKNTLSSIAFCTRLTVVPKRELHVVGVAFRNAMCNRRKRLRKELPVVLMTLFSVVRPSKDINGQ